jgi:hypothetical protein
MHKQSYLTTYSIDFYQQRNLYSCTNIIILNREITIRHYHVSHYLEIKQQSYSQVSRVNTNDDNNNIHSLYRIKISTTTNIIIKSHFKTIMMNAYSLSITHNYIMLSSLTYYGIITK